MSFLIFEECLERKKMEDRDIIELFWQRNEDAIHETKNKYHTILYKIAYNILMNHQDCEEMLNDTYFKVWNSIPPYRPSHLASFLIRITRELSIDCLRKKNRQKRIPQDICIPIDELAEIVSAKETVDDIISEAQLAESINDFLQKLNAADRKLFVRRYFFAESIPSISQTYGMNEAGVKTRLYRIRQKLKNYLEKKGYEL